MYSQLYAKSFVFIDGHFVYSFYEHPMNSLLKYEQVPVDGIEDHCMVFWYFMSGYVGTLNVYINNTNNVTSSPVWHRTDDYGPKWRQAEILIPVDTFPLDVVCFK